MYCLMLLTSNTSYCLENIVTGVLVLVCYVTFILQTEETRYVTKEEKENSNKKKRQDWYLEHNTAQKMKFSIKNFVSKCDQIRRILLI